VVAGSAEGSATTALMLAHLDDQNRRIISEIDFLRSSVVWRPAKFLVRDDVPEQIRMALPTLEPRRIPKLTSRSAQVRV
jgi:hypothetical protein